MSPERAKEIDSLSAHEFQVEVNGKVAAGVFSVHGLTSYVADGELPPLTITKMVQRDPATPFNEWARETLKGKAATRDVAIIALDEGHETRRWVYRKAKITGVSFSDFNSALNELVAEAITVVATRVEEVWPK
jgi:hypothetical protein